MKVTSTDKILTRYWQTSYNHLEWKTREQQTNCEDENSPPPLLHSSRPPPPGERSGPIRGEITNSADSWSNPTLTFLLRWKEEKFKANAKILSTDPATTRRRKQRRFQSTHRAMVEHASRKARLPTWFETSRHTRFWLRWENFMHYLIWSAPQSPRGATTFTLISEF